MKSRLGSNTVADKSKLKQVGKKSRNRPSPGLSVSEFIDSAGVNSRETGVGSPGSAPETKNKGKLGRAVEKALANPTLLIAGLAAIPVLFVVWGLTRRRKRHEDESAEK